jgi:hypothetical protein
MGCAWSKPQVSPADARAATLTAAKGHSPAGRAFLGAPVPRYHPRPPTPPLPAFQIACRRGHCLRQLPQTHLQLQQRRKRPAATSKSHQTSPEKMQSGAACRQAAAQCMHVFSCQATAP